MLRYLLLAVVLTGGSCAVADDSLAENTPSAEQVDQWIADLASPKAELRREASQQLFNSANAQVVEQLAKVAQGTVIESGVRSLQIIARILEQHPDNNVKAAALQAIETSAGMTGPVAKLAEATLQRRKLADNLPRPATSVRVSVSISNDVRTIVVSEDDRKVQFKDVGGKDFEVEVTTTVNGQPNVVKHQAPDLATLKLNQPELATLFEKYSQNVRFNAGFVPGLLPGQQRAIPRLQPAAAKAAASAIEEALVKLKLVQDELGATADLTAEQRTALQEKLDSLRKDLFTAQAALE